MWWLKHISSELLFDNYVRCSFCLILFKQPTEWSDELLSIFLITLILPIKICCLCDNQALLEHYKTGIEKNMHALSYITFNIILQSPLVCCSLITCPHIVIDNCWTVIGSPNQSESPKTVVIINVKWTNINIYPLSLCLSLSNTPTDTHASKH